MKNLHKVMQSPYYYPTELKIWVDEHGLFYGKVYGNEILFFMSRKKQFINELLEELDEKAGTFLDQYELVKANTK